MLTNTAEPWVLSFEIWALLGHWKQKLNNVTKQDQNTMSLLLFIVSSEEFNNSMSPSSSEFITESSDR